MEYFFLYHFTFSCVSDADFVFPASLAHMIPSNLPWLSELWKHNQSCGSQDGPKPCTASLTLYIWRGSPLNQQRASFDGAGVAAAAALSSTRLAQTRGYSERALIDWPGAGFNGAEDAFPFRRRSLWRTRRWAAGTRHGKRSEWTSVWTCRGSTANGANFINGYISGGFQCASPNLRWACKCKGNPPSQQENKQSAVANQRQTSLMIRENSVRHRFCFWSRQ